MGGIEHIPVHHTNEIAQSESANGVQFVNYWLHNEHLLVDNKKMAKSEGTGYSLSEVKSKGFNPLALRYLFLTAHYRSKLNFTWKSLEASENALNKLYEFMQTPPFKKGAGGISSSEKKFQQALENNLDTPKALAIIWEMIKSKELNCDNKKTALLKFDKVLGLGLDKITTKEIKISDEVKGLIKERDKARENKDWKKADELREEIKKRGLVVEDKSVG